ncbi:unnamed protein product [Ixodes pacificus]
MLFLLLFDQLSAKFVALCRYLDHKALEKKTTQTINESCNFTNKRTAVPPKTLTSTHICFVFFLSCPFASKRASQNRGLRPPPQKRATTTTSTTTNTKTRKTLVV